MGSHIYFLINLFLFISIAYCNNVTFKGYLNPDCVKAYHQMYVTRRVPPRSYQYFHEANTADTTRAGTPTYRANNNVELKWRIIGGKQVSIREVPYQVLYGRFCGGTLIAPNWVITAAHCKVKDDFILAGSTHRSQATSYPICAHFIHPLWNTSSLHSHDFDYQLVLLERPVPVTPNSRPIAIGSLDDVKPGAIVAVSGWGHIKYKQRQMEDIVRRVYVPIMSHEECQSLPLLNYKKITPRMFCAGQHNGTKDSCQGDSGGPAVVNGKLIGLVSFGVGCAEKDQPGVYTNIPKARLWIREVTGLPL